MTTWHRLQGTGFVLALLASAVGLGARPASAQVDQQLEDLGASQDEVLRYGSRSVRGDSITFCINSDALTAAFDRDVARALTEALLLNYDLYEITTVPPTPPYDFRLLLDDLVVFRLLLNRCDAIMGFTLLANYPSWMTPSPPYLSTETVLAVRAGQYGRLADVPTGKLLGTRSFSLADNYLLAYASTLPKASRWQRVAYPSNRAAVDHLVDGTVDAVLVWEPALLAYEVEHPVAPLIDILPLPFTVPATQLVLALRPQDDFVNAALSQAIQALHADGVLHRLAEQHGLVPVDTDGRR